MSEPTVFGPEATDQIAKTVREVARRMKNSAPVRGRWQHQPVSLNVTHGIVNAKLGCGFYTIEKATWTGSQDAAGAGIGYVGNGVNDCDVCYDVVGEGTSGCGITLTYPPCMVTGTGETVTAYDEASSLIPLIVGTSCKMLSLGDVDAVTGDPIWQIIRGVMQHVVEYKEVWDCCDGVGQTGTETLISRTPVILIGKECQPISCGDCY